MKYMLDTDITSCIIKPKHPHREMKRVFNFNAGPAALPTEVLEQARDEFLSYHDTGISIMEMSHRGKIFKDIATEAEQDLRDLLHIPAEYKVLFVQGGGRAQYTMVPMNLLRDKDTADYVKIGMWSKISISEAADYCRVNIVADSEKDNFTTIPAVENWNVSRDAAYLHFVDNETIHGVEFREIPAVADALLVPLVSDMSSNLLSRPFDITRFGCVYACAQKNVGPAGLTIVIVREDLLGEALPITPTMYNYQTYANSDSLYNTPPTFSWYMAGLMFKWLKKQGGVEAIADINDRKAQKIYDYIDSTEFYKNPVDPGFRSRMNVIFTLPNDALTEIFVKEAEQHNLSGLKGHRSVGGIRASLYNAVPEKAVDVLIAFMADFIKKHG